MNEGERISGWFFGLPNVFVSEAAHRRLGAGPSRPRQKQQFLISFPLCNLSQTLHSPFSLFRNSHFHFVWPVLSLWSASKKIVVLLLASECILVKGSLVKKLPSYGL